MFRGKIKTNKIRRAKIQKTYRHDINPMEKDEYILFTVSNPEVAAIGQSIRAFALQAEDWVFESLSR